MIDTPTTNWSPEQLALVNDGLQDASPRTVLQWGLEQFGSRLAIATGFGPSGVVLLHIASKLDQDATYFYVDTDLLFDETYAFRDALAERLGIRFTRVHSGLDLNEQADRFGEKLWARDPNQCCFLRKVQPLRRFLATQEAWATGIRRDQSKSRQGIGLVEWDRINHLPKLNPLAGWTEEDIWAYIELHELPYNPLHDQGYPSLGCVPCTRAVAPGEDPRAGRWPGHSKTECGIHTADSPR